WVSAVFMSGGHGTAEKIWSNTGSGENCLMKTSRFSSDHSAVSTVAAAQARTPDEGANWWEHEWKAKASPYQAQPPQEERDRQRHRTEGRRRKHVHPQPQGN
ncbi:unnamed protein product, partial [Meganyctiphanes norvegica]